MGDGYRRIAATWALGGLAVLVGLSGCFGIGDSDDDSGGDCVPKCFTLEGAVAQCGSDGCGGSCGGCSADRVCQNGTCTVPTVYCLSSAECGSQSICVNQECANAYGRAYKVTLVSAVIKEYNANGSSWDALGGMPDPFVTWEVGGEVIFTSSVWPDTFTPDWTETFTMNVIAGERLDILVWDEDMAVSDPVGGFYSDSGLPIEWLKEGSVDLFDDSSGNGVSSLSFLIEPK